MKLTPWRENAIPHADVHKGTFQRAEFAADITRVHEGSATAEYVEPVLFFQRTFITEGMGALLTSVARRLAGKGGDPVIQLQTAFGGGKTHTMLAVLHMAGGKAPATELAGIPAVLDRAEVLQLPAARVVVLDGINLSPSQPRTLGGQRVATLWGELAWQLGGAEGHARVAEADATGTSPGKEVLTQLLAAHAPCVILIDELVAYIRQFEEGAKLSGGTFDSNLSFIQALTEAVKAVPTAVLLASLPESDREAGSERGIAALRALEHYFGRIQAIWKPVGTKESFEIVRRRLFERVVDQDAANAVCRAFADHYVTHADQLPGETTASEYLQDMRAAYPIHPEVFERLYKDWSSLPNFQRTRGVLKLMARVIHRLWQDNNQDPLLLPGSLPIYDNDVQGELVSHLPPGWDPVVERDVDGENSEPARMEQDEPRFGAVQACRRVTRSIFLGSAPAHSNRQAAGIATERVLLGCLQPGQAPHVYRDALGRLEQRLTFLNKGENRWWLDVRPNLRREMEDRKRRFSDAEINDEIHNTLRRVMGSGSKFDAHHLFSDGADVPDDWSLRLVVLPPASAWARSGPNPARDAAQAILRNRGEQPRQKQNRLLFLAADADQVLHLKDTVRSLLAWRSIEVDIKDLRLTLDNQQARQVSANRTQAAETVTRSVREAFRWLIAPSQSPQRNGGIGDVEWESFALNPGQPGLGAEMARVVEEHELVIREWAPVHLANLLKRWFWKADQPAARALDVWQKSCHYLYMPRLHDSRVMQAAIAAGAASRDFFGLAYGGSDEGYPGFSFGRSASPTLDSLVLIEPAHAAEHEARIAPPPAPEQPEATVSTPVDAVQDVPGARPGAPLASPSPAAPAQAARPTHFYASAELDPLNATLEFSRIVSELVELFTSKPGAQVSLKVDIHATDSRGFDEVTVRAGSENSRSLGVADFSFDE